jgi:hypothetical protein
MMDKIEELHNRIAVLPIEQKVDEIKRLIKIDSKLIEGYIKRYINESSDIANEAYRRKGPLGKLRVNIGNFFDNLRG